MSEHLVREIFRAAANSSTRVLNQLSLYYVYDKKLWRWARKLENCRDLIGKLPRPILVKILSEVTK